MIFKKVLQYFCLKMDPPNYYKVSQNNFLLKIRVKCVEIKNIFFKFTNPISNRVRFQFKIFTTKNRINKIVQKYSLGCGVVNYNNNKNKCFV